MFVNIPLTQTPEQDIPLLAHLKLLGLSSDPGSPTKSFCPFSKELTLTEGFVKAVILYNAEVNPTAL